MSENSGLECSDSVRPHYILTIGDPRLEQPSAPVTWPDAEFAAQVETLHAALAEFRAEHGFGRAIAAPQVGIAKRFIALHLGDAPLTMVNPEITWRSDAMFDVWDDCMSVPDHVVRVSRHRSISVQFRDEHDSPHEWTTLPPDTSELLQHEIDHLDGVLMTTRAVGEDAVRPISERTALVESARAAMQS